MDEYLRELERLANTGDTQAQARLFAMHVRIRGYPEGPWDNPLWYREFLTGVNYLTERNLHEGQVLFVSNARDYYGRLDRPVHPQQVEISIVPLTQQIFYTQAVMWLDMNTHIDLSHHGEDPQAIDGFLVIFEGYFGMGWTTLFYPYQVAQHGIDELRRLFRWKKVPMVRQIGDRLQAL